MECPGHGTPELPPPLAGERPEDVEKNVIAECIMRHYSGLKYMRKYAKILKINLYFENSGVILDIENKCVNTHLFSMCV